MNGITGGIDISNLDWSKALTGLAESIGCEGVEVTGALVDDQISLTMTDKTTGTSVTETYRPELDPAQLGSDFDPEAAQTAVSAKLTEMNTDLKAEMAEAVETANAAAQAGLVTKDSEGAYSKAMFNIYALVRLIQECAQEQKAISRNVREADLQASLAATHAEADAQRAAARKGLAMTIGLSVLMTGVGIGVGAKGLNKMMKATKLQTGGAFGRASKKCDQLLKGSNAKLSGKARATAGKKLSADEKLEIDSSFEQHTSKPAASKPNSALDKSEGIELQNLGEAKPQAAGKKADVGKLEEKQAGLEQKTTEAQHELDLAREGGDKKAISAAEAKYDKCLRQEQYGRSIVTDEKAKLGMTDSLKADLTAAETELSAVAKHSPETARKIAQLQSSGQMLSMTGSAVLMMGQLGAQVGGSVQQVESAAATEIDAEVKESDARREEDNEVFSTAQELIDKVLDLYSQVVQSESQSTDRIIQA